MLTFVAVLRTCLQRNPRPQEEAVELVGSNETDATEAGVADSFRNAQLMCVLDLGDRGDYELLVPAAAATSKEALQRHIREACIRKLGRKLTPPQWLNKSTARQGMSILLNFEDPPSQSKLTDKTPRDRIRDAACVLVMPI